MGAAAAALAVFCVYAAPIVLSGSATFAGYISLDDTATWLALVDNAMTHGRSLAGLAPSTYSALLRVDLGTGYPIGSMLPLGVGHELTGQDTAWLFQPYIAFAAAMVSLSVYALVSPLLRSRFLRALVAFVGAQPALLYGYALWSGVKELAVAALVVLVSALAASALTAPLRVRAQIPLAVAAAAVLACLESSRPRLACRTCGGRRSRRRVQRRQARRDAARVRASPAAWCSRFRRWRPPGSSCASAPPATPVTGRSATCSIRSAACRSSASGLLAISAAAQHIWS